MVFERVMVPLDMWWCHCSFRPECLDWNKKNRNCKQTADNYINNSFIRLEKCVPQLCFNWKMQLQSSITPILVKREFNLSCYEGDIIGEVFCGFSLKFDTCKLW